MRKQFRFLLFVWAFSLAFNGLGDSSFLFVLAPWAAGFVLLLAVLFFGCVLTIAFVTFLDLDLSLQKLSFDVSWLGVLPRLLEHIIGVWKTYFISISNFSVSFKTSFFRLRISFLRLFSSFCDAGEDIDSNKCVSDAPMRPSTCKFLDRLISNWWFVQLPHRINPDNREVFDQFEPVVGGVVWHKLLYVLVSDAKVHRGEFDLFDS